MKIEDQVCTLDQAKKLKKLGVTYKPIFLYWDFSNVSESFFHTAKAILHFGHHCPAFGRIQSELEECWNPAYTVAELGMTISGFGYKLPMKNQHFGWLEFKADLHYATEAEARAAMLIYLLENNLITPEEVNQKLAQ